MKMPTVEELNAMTVIIAGEPTLFINISPEAKVQVVDLCLKASINEQLYDISCDTNEHLAEIGKWFKLSKLWEGRIDG